MIGYLFGKNSNKVAVNTGKLNPVNITPAISQKPSNLYAWSIPVSNPEKNFYLRFMLETIGDKHKLSVELDGIRNRLKIIINKQELSGTIWSELGNKEQLNRYLIDPSDYISWSLATKQFAVLLPGKILVYKYNTELIPSDTYSPPRLKIILTKTNEFIANEKFDRFDTPSVLFSGNSKELYFSNKSGIKMFLPEEKVFNTRTGYYPSYIYPIPNSFGIAYWINEGNKPDYNNHYFVIDSGNSFKKIKIHSDFSIDFPGKILLSPDLQKACIGWQSSGSKGSLLFDLNSGNKILGGEGCMQWLSNTQVVLYSSNSPTGENGYVFYYLFDLVTNKKVFLHNFYTGI